MVSSNALVIAGTVTPPPIPMGSMAGQITQFGAVCPAPSNPSRPTANRGLAGSSWSWRWSPEAGVDARGETLLGGDGFEQAGELCVLGVVERGADVVLMRGADRTHLGHHAGALRGEVQGVVAAVLCVPPSFDEPFALQAVDQCDDPARYDSQLLGQGLLAASRLGGDHAQQPDVGGDHSEFADPLGEPRRGVSTHLCEQERRSRRPLPRCRAAIAAGPSSCGHAVMVVAPDSSVL